MDSLMIFWFFLIGIIVGVIIGLTLIHKVAIDPLHKKIEILSENVYTKEAKHDFFEKLKNNYYPYSIENFRYINNPFDGIQFEDDQILFVSTSREISSNQKKCIRLIQQGKVKWLDFQIL